MPGITLDTPPLSPCKEEVLFRDDLPDYWNNACLNSMYGSDEIAYIEGYRRGAELLVRYVNEAQRDQDYLVYPIIVLYRHHIELILKEITVRVPFVLGWELTGLEKQHRILSRCSDPSAKRLAGQNPAAKTLIASIPPFVS